MRDDTEIYHHRLWAETLAQLDEHAARVAENRDVMQALDFGRFVLKSRLDKVLEPVSRDGPLKVDAALVRWKAEELVRACQERFQFNDSRPHLDALQLQSINQKLNTIAGYLAQLAGPGAASVPQLNVISGGLDETAGVVVERNATA